MDKQKQQQIEELIGIIQGAVGGCATYWASLIAEEVLKYYQPKIHENAVVLTIPEKERLLKSALRFDQTTMECLANEVRKETAEKFAERLKDLEEALLDMVVQFCQMGEEGKLKHIFMSAEEQAFDVLDITYGENVDDVYERFNKKWDRPIDEIAKEITEGNNAENGE